YNSQPKFIYSLSSPANKKAIDECNQIIKSLSNLDLLTLIYSPSTPSPHLSIFSIKYALYKLWKSWGVNPDIVIGDGIGEYVAATVAGVFSLEDGLKLVANIDKSDFEKIANSIKYSSPQFEIISGINGKLIDSEILNPQYWCKQISQSASFDKIIGYLKESNCGICLELGVKSSLLELEIENLSSTEILFLSSLSESGNNNQDWNVILSSLAQMYVNGVNIDWQGFDKDYYLNQVLLPNYPFQRQLYYVDVVGNKLKNRRDAESAEERSYRGVILHPLLGEKLDLSRSNTIYFQHSLNLNNLTYLQQHQVFDKVIIPGSGYIEMAFAAGSIVFKTDNLILENLEILQPLILSDNSDTITQVVLESQQEQEYKFEILSLSTASDNIKGWRISRFSKIK
ncbi:MAG: acyltransferase domain-containing protein, partial [Cyanobacteria bacterium J06636_27]